jgi:D-alanyl-D-alanine carboxypeptidase
MRRRAFLLSAAATAAACATDGTPAEADVRADTALDRQLDALLAPYVAAKDFSGVVLVERGGALAAERFYGAADFASGRANTRDTRYVCSSIGKMFTRAAVLSLAADGRLSLDDPFARFAPDFPNGANFTIGQLIEHRAGISRDLTLGADVRRALSTTELVARVAAMPVAGAPGERYAYSNNGYRLLAYAIERVGRGDYGAIVRERVFAPRNMRSTAEYSLADAVPNRAIGYVPGRGLGTLEQAPAEELLNHRGPGSFYTTPNDLMMFARSLPLTPADMQTPLEAGAKRRLGHNGLGHGYASMCYVYPDIDVRLVMTCNIQMGLLQPLEGAFEALLFGEDLPAMPVSPTQAAALDVERARRVAGNYELFPGTPLIVRLSGDLLEVSAGGDAYAPLTPLGGDRYFMRQRYGTLTFNVANGWSESVTWAEPGGEFNLRRLD